MQPTVGRVVHYTLTAQDAESINGRRNDAGAFARSLAGGIEPGERGRTGHVLHAGNEATEGDVCAATVVRTFDGAGQEANLQVCLDGNDAYWATSRSEGDGPGFWAWPPRV